LLMAWRDKSDAVARFVKGIQDADVAMPANPENVRDFAVDQIFGDEVRTLHPWHRVSPMTLVDFILLKKQVFYIPTIRDGV